MSMLDLAKIVERTQRNFIENEVLPREHVQQIIDTAKSMPTKQQRPFYKIIASTDRMMNRELFESASHDEEQQGVAVLKNGQIYAPLLLIFLTNEDEIKKQKRGIFNEPRKKTHRARELARLHSGIAVGAAALSAAELGYRTGFSACYVKEKLVNIINKHYPYTISQDPDIHVMLGIGNHNSNFDRRDIVLDGVKVNQKKSHGDKNITVIHLNN